MSILNDSIRLKSDMVKNPFEYLGIARPRKTLTVSILGDKGKGKTLFMAIISMMYNVLKTDFYTNFSMPSFIKYRKEFNIKNLYNNPNIQGIFLDEMHNIADQNSNHTLETQLLKAIFTQSRKRNQLILYSSLRRYMIAKDIRELTDLIIYPEYVKENDCLYLLIFNYKEGWMNETQLNNVSRFFRFFNTYEIVIDENIKYRLSSYLLKHQKIKEEINKKLDKDEKNLLNHLEEKMRE